MLARPSAGQSSTILPSKFVLKLVDPRFVERKEEIWGLMSAGKVTEWTPEVDAEFKIGLANVRNGVWRNYWKDMGAIRDVPMKEYDDADYDDAPRWNFINEVRGWCYLRASLAREVAAYQLLRDLQGIGIPRLYGTCIYNCDVDDLGLDPLISNVPGILLEHIEGTPMDKLTLGTDISADDAERISQGILAVYRKFRDHLLIHGDFGGRNVIVRLDDLDHPVIIDFGAAEMLSTSDGTEYEEWKETIVRVGEPFLIRRFLSNLGFHKPSPIPEQIEEYDNKWETGHVRRNMKIEDMRAEWRDALYERVVPDPSTAPPIFKKSPGGKEYRWEPSRWNVRPGVSTANASADFRWGKDEYK